MSKQYTTINVETKQSTAWITLNRPNKLNAINSMMLTELSNAADTIKADNNIKCVIITGNTKAFSAGADLAELQTLTPEKAAKFSEMGQQVFSKIESMRKPVIAAIKGCALGGGLELALACDFRLASNNAQLGCPEIKLGLLPAWGATQRLPQIIGDSNAKHLITVGDKITAKEALTLCLVDKVVPTEMLNREAENLAKKICANPSTAIKYVKNTVDAGTDGSVVSGYKKETDSFVKLFSSQETKKRLESFLNRETKK